MSVFFGHKFKSFDDAEDWLCTTLNNDYEGERGEYDIVEDSPTRESNYLDPNDPRSARKVIS